MGTTVDPRHRVHARPDVRAGLLRGDRPDAGRGRRRQGCAPGGAVADRRRPRAAWLLRDDGRVPGGSWRKRRRSTIGSIGCRAWTRTTGSRSARSARRSAGPSKAIAIPDDVAAAITGALARLGEHAAYAVRSSATAEDLPTASFAGQQDTYLNVVGPAAILQHVSRCWASLFTERAVTYRLRNGVDHRQVHMAVVVQQMVFPEAAGVLFTADPVTSNRKVVSVEATFGLGEALVSGLVNADVYQVRDGEIVAKAVATKQLAVHASPAGGTQEEAIEPARQGQPALTDAQVVRLAAAGPADRSALRLPPGHRVVPGRRWLPDRPEPADHHAVPHPGGRRPREPRLRLRRSSADDDGPHEAPRALGVAADGPPADVRGRREAVRRRHRGRWRRHRAAPACWRSWGDPIR